MTRRTILRSTAVGSVVALGASAALAQDDEALAPGTIELGGERSGWQGQSPDSIGDETNPTLRLQAGETYEVVWENLDGLSHNFVIEDADGEDVLSTDLMNSIGETQTVPEFEATSEMAEYYCAPHAGTMRGDIEIVGGDGGGGDETDDDAGNGDGGGDALFQDGPSVGLETVAEGLTAPTAFEVADEDADRRFVADQTGQIYVHGEDGLEDEPFLDVGDRMVELREGFDERGLLGVAFHPEFDENGRLFVRYSAPPTDETPDDYDHTFVVAEFETAGDDNETADPDSERRILEIPEPQFNHNAGPVAFGPDDYLYVATGDGGGANDVGVGHVDDWYDDNEGGNGQDTTENLLGGVLRIDVDAEGDGDRPYGIPEDNPLVDEENHRGEYYAWGMRNPWGMSFNDETLVAADVGQNLYEEINVVRRGGNYGWNVKEGTHCFSPETPEEPPEDCPDETPDDVRGGEALIDPVIEYPHTYEDQQIGISVIGGYVYDGDAVDALEDAYVFGDWSESGEEASAPLFVAYPPDDWNEDDGDEDDDGDDGDETESDDGTWDVERLLVEGDLGQDGRLSRFVWAFGRDADDEVYVLTTEQAGPTGDTGAVHRIVPATDDESDDDEGDDAEDDGDDANDDDGGDDGDDADDDTDGNETNDD